jgi:hypothetical protein
MTNQTNDAFSWGALGQKWWEENGAACRATPTQIRFAACRHLGCNKAKSAALAGYKGSPEALRSTGVRAEGSTAVEHLLTLAQAAESDTDPESLTAKEIDRKLAKLVRSPDGALALKALETHEKREALKRQRPSEEATTEEAVRDLVALCTPSMAALVWCELGMRVYRWHTPFLQLFVPHLLNHYPDHWMAYRPVLAAEDGRMDSDVRRLERGPLLTIEQILKEVGVKRPGNGAVPHVDQSAEGASLNA